MCRRGNTVHRQASKWIHVKPGPILEMPRFNADSTQMLSALFSWRTMGGNNRKVSNECFLYFVSPDPLNTTKSGERKSFLKYRKHSSFERINGYF
jgi:hypothetical protein